MSEIRMWFGKNLFTDVVEKLFSAESKITPCWQQREGISDGNSCRHPCISNAGNRPSLYKEKNKNNSVFPIKW